jgi:aspartate aminotransferase-like enzyme
MYNKPRLLTPGPTPLPEEVRLALARDMIHHRKPVFKKILAACQEGLQELFGTKEPVLVLSASGTGAMDAAATNCFKPGEKVLVVEAGKFGERWREIATARGLIPAPLVLEWGKAVRAKDVAEAAAKHPDAVGLLVQASETSTGVLHPIQELGEVCRANDLLLVVDGISAVGISPCPMDAWGVDCLLTGSQKGLMLPPGLSFMALSQQAWERVEATKPNNFYFNLMAEREKIRTGQTLFTSAVNLVVGLEACLAHFREIGLNAVFQKQWAMTMLARTSAQAMGLELLAKEHFTWGLTSVLLPEGMDGVRLLQIAVDEYGVVFAGGQDRLKGRIVRIGHMGHVDWADVAAGVQALARSYQRCGGYIGCRDYLEQGLAAYENALTQHVGC